MNNNNFLVLMIGNSRLHWARFLGGIIVETWHSQHLSSQELPEYINSSHLPLYLASVVPQQTKFWENYLDVKVINLSDIPLKEKYPTLGIDRALALWGAGNKYGFPCLVIDGGTALTFTGANGEKGLVGGAILPGLRLQFQSLANQTAALPEVNLPDNLPQRWTKETPAAMQSGVIYTVLATIKDFIVDWLEQFPHSQLILTGGDGKNLFNYLQVQYPEITSRIVVDADLIFWGIKSVLEPGNCPHK